MGLANDATRLRTASVRQDHRQYCVLVLRTHPVGAEKVFFTNVAILRRTGIDRLHVAGTNPSHQRWFLPVSATRLRRYRCAVSRDERHCAATLRVR